MALLNVVLSPSSGSTVFISYNTVSAGSNAHTIGLDNYGQIWCWGFNANGQLGNNSLSCKSTPVSILGAKKTFCAISTGSDNSYGIDKNGQIWCWGFNINLEPTNKCTPVSILGAKKTFCKISAGMFHTTGIDKNGQGWTWGYNAYGELGDNTQIDKSTPVSILGAKKTFCNIYPGAYHTIGLDNNNQIWCWGANNRGELGNNSISSKLTPVSILGAKKTFCYISAANGMSVGHTIGLDKNGQIWCWGLNDYGQLGINSITNKSTPVSILGIKKTFCQISAGSKYSLGIDNNNIVWCWGYNNYGQLGDNSIISERTPVRVYNTTYNSGTKKLEFTVDASHLIYLYQEGSTTTTTTTINVLSSSILLNDSNLPANVYAYFPNTLSYSLLTVPGITAASGDIAHTSNKMWLYYDSNNIDEWNITLSPWTATYNRRISNFSNSPGLCAINDTKLISVNYPNVYESDITTTTASNTLIFSSLISGRTISGDYMLTTTNKFIITTVGGFNVYISQYDYSSGALEFDIDISSMSTTKAPYGLFEYNNDIYIANGDGVIYKIDKTSPFNTTSIYSGITFTIYGASEIPSLINVNFSGTTTTTTTVSPTTTTTTTTVSPTTTTTSTTVAFANIQVSNAGAGGDQIVGVSLNSVTVSSVPFPVGLSGFYVGTTTQLAGYGINVDYNVSGTRSISFYLNGSGTHFYCTSISSGTGTVLSSPIGLSIGDTVLVLLSTAVC